VFCLAANVVNNVSKNPNKTLIFPVGRLISIFWCGHHHCHSNATVSHTGFQHKHTPLPRSPHVSCPGAQPNVTSHLELWFSRACLGLNIIDHRWPTGVTLRSQQNLLDSSRLLIKATIFFFLKPWCTTCRLFVILVLFAA